MDGHCDLVLGCRYERWVSLIVRRRQKEFSGLAMMHGGPRRLKQIHLGELLASYFAQVSRKCPGRDIRSQLR
jgi:hypothetical protein